MKHVFMNSIVISLGKDYVQTLGKEYAQTLGKLCVQTGLVDMISLAEEARSRWKMPLYLHSTFERMCIMIIVKQITRVTRVFGLMIDSSQASLV